MHKSSARTRKAELVPCTRHTDESKIAEAPAIVCRSNLRSPYACKIGPEEEENDFSCETRTGV